MLTSKKELRKKGIALSEIFIFVISLLAFSYMIGNEIGLAGAVIPTDAGAVSTVPSNVLNLAELGAKVYEAMGPLGQAIADTALYTALIGVVIFPITFMITGGDTNEAWFWARAYMASFGAGELAFQGLNLASEFAAEKITDAAIAEVVSEALSWLAGPVKIVTTLYMLWELTRRQEGRAVTLECRPWQAQEGWENCDLCNHQEFGCTEYQCKSLGTACQLINKDTSEPRCIGNKDRNPPTITPWKEILPENYSYETISERAVKIKYGSGECLPTYNEFEFGVTLDKPGVCKISNVLTNNFEEMGNLYMSGENIYKENHSQIMTFPVGGTYKYYVRCANINGDATGAEFEFQFCVEEGADTGEPIIRGFNLLDKTPIQYFEESDAHEISISAYVNEPAQCKWDFTDKDYASMENSMSCVSTASEFNTQLSYPCSGTLTGLENLKENKFYFRCNDTGGNFNSKSKSLSLLGTEPLTIESVGPAESSVIRGSTENVEVTFTALTAGYRDGKAMCFYSPTGNQDDYTGFDNTESNSHSHALRLPAGEYTYYIKCVDMGGNIDTKTTSFTVESDYAPPIVVRIYQESGELKIVTNEIAECVYSTTTTGCGYNFDDGQILTTSNDIEHFAEWNTQSTFYIKCRDAYENQPAQSDCSVIARPFDAY